MGDSKKKATTIMKVADSNSRQAEGGRLGLAVSGQCSRNSKLMTNAKVKPSDDAQLKKQTSDDNSNSTMTSRPRRNQDTAASNQCLQISRSADPQMSMLDLMWAEANISSHREEEEVVGMTCKRSSASKALRNARRGCGLVFVKKEGETRKHATCRAWKDARARMTSRTSGAGLAKIIWA